MSNWKVQHFNNEKVDCKIAKNITGDIVVEGNITGGSNKTFSFIAPNPPTYMTSYYGSGTAYPNPEIAFDQTPNVGCVTTDIMGKFKVTIKSPSGYYIRMGTIYQPPHLMLYTDNNKNIINIVLGEGVPYRPQTYTPPPSEWPHVGAEFYTNPLISGKIRSQEQILRESAYPSNNKWAKNFWGLKPPC
jgi:hypothetical protein